MNVQMILASKGTDVETVGPDSTVVRAAHDLKRLGIGCLVVCGDDGKVLGLLTERDVVLGVAAQGGDLTHTRVSHVMTRRVITCEPSDNVTDVMTKMTNFRVRQMPVLDHGRLCGLVSIGDVVKSRLDDMQLETTVLRDAYTANH